MLIALWNPRWCKVFAISIWSHLEWIVEHGRLCRIMRGCKHWLPKCIHIIIIIGSNKVLNIERWNLYVLQRRGISPRGKWPRNMECLKHRTRVHHSLKEITLLRHFLLRNSPTWTTTTLSSPTTWVVIIWNNLLFKTWTWVTCLKSARVMLGTKWLNTFIYIKLNLK